ncbi:ClpA/ClpB-like protein [Nocardia tenerifensis]|uniref:ClpA/ClpB-like protein n=1 Tax=Nocardia tenerifensis TaxID=228006 RepID=A0A318JNQ6_9NOCA|nr:Clp protease N-terminal domain-containing protein [Nocardia tenerifensis]PXX53412.1 ClpA/ClpB-like protein [Nocardia tenerifensis]
MFDDFDPWARRAIVLAQQYAGELGHDAIEGEHLMLALLDPRAEAFGVTTFLAASGVDPTELRGALLGSRGPGSIPAQDDGAQIPMAGRLKRILRLAHGDFQDAGAPALGAEHLLLGLLRDGRSVAADALLQRGVVPESARTQLNRRAAIDIVRTRGAIAAPVAPGQSPETFLVAMRDRRTRRADVPRVRDPRQPWARIVQEAIPTLRQRASADPSRGLPALARALCTASDLMSRTGRAIDALEMAAEATAIHERLAKADSDRFTSVWIESRRVLAARNHRCGRHDDAVEIAGQLVRHYRRHADGSTPPLTEMFCDTAIYLRDSGATATAYDTASAAVRALQDSTGPTLRARALCTLAECANITGRGVEALTTARTAYHITREFGAGSTPELRGLHARCAGTFGRCMPPGRAAEQAAALVSESVAEFRLLESATPGRWLPELANAVHGLAIVHARNGLDADIVRVAAEEAVRLWGQLAEVDPDGAKQKLTAAALTLAGIHQ